MAFQENQKLLLQLNELVTTNVLRMWSQEIKGYKEGNEPFHI